MSESKAIWFDEELGLSASRSSNVQGVLSALAKPVDINPPMFHVLAHYSMNVLGDTKTAARLPSLAGMLLFLMCLYTFVSRRLTQLYGILGVLIVLTTTVSIYAWEARPYGLVLGLTGIAMVLYQRCLESSAIRWRVLFLGTIACFPFAHYYAVLVIAPFALAECTRAILRQRVEWLVLIGTMVSPCVAIALLMPLITAQSGLLTHMHSQASVLSFRSGFNFIMSTPQWLIYLVIFTLALTPWLRPHSRARGFDSASRSLNFRPPEMVLGLSLMLLPLLGAICALLITKIYIGRYFIAAAAGYAIVSCSILAFLCGKRSGGAFLLICIGIVFLVFQLAVAIKSADLASHSIANVSLLARDNNKPIVFEDAKDYILARNLNPADSHRYYYCAEPDAAVQLTGTDSDDRLMLALASVQAVQVRRLQQIYELNSTWHVVPGSHGWLLECLAKMSVVTHSHKILAPNANQPIVVLGVTFSVNRSEPMIWCEAPFHHSSQPSH